MEEADITPLTYVDLLRYLGPWILMSTYYGWKREGFWNVTPFDQESNPYPYCLGVFMSKHQFNTITHELSYINTNPLPPLC